MSYDSLTVAGETSCLDEPSDTASVSVNEITQLSLYPNPTRNSVNIFFENNEDRMITVYSMEGVRVEQIVSAEKEIVLDLSSHVNGTYMVTVKGSRPFARARVVKQYTSIDNLKRLEGLAFFLIKTICFC